MLVELGFLAFVGWTFKDTVRDTYWLFKRQPKVFCRVCNRDLTAFADVRIQLGHGAFACPECAILVQAEMDRILPEWFTERLPPVPPAEKQTGPEQQDRSEDRYNRNEKAREVGKIPDHVRESEIVSYFCYSCRHRLIYPEHRFGRCLTCRADGKMPEGTEIRQILEEVERCGGISGATGECKRFLYEPPPSMVVKIVAPEEYRYLTKTD